MEVMSSCQDKNKTTKRKNELNQNPWARNLNKKKWKNCKALNNESDENPHRSKDQWKITELGVKDYEKIGVWRPTNYNSGTK